MKNIVRFAQLKPSLLKTVLFNFKYLPVKLAKKLPVLVAKQVVFTGNGNVHLSSSDIRTGMIKIGFGDVGIFDRKFSRTLLQIDGKLIIEEKMFIGHGSRLVIEKNGLLEVGKNLTISAEGVIICRKHIRFAANALLSWGVQIMDTDYHEVYFNDININQDEEILIGNQVWIGARSMIMKGVSIPDNTVVAAGAVLTKKYTEANTILGGIPAKVVKRNISWKP